MTYTWEHMLFATVIAGLLTGCTAPSTARISAQEVLQTRDATATETAVQFQTLLPIAVAKALAKACPSFDLDHGARALTEDGLRNALEAQGHSRREARQIVGSVDRRVQKHSVAAYAQSKALDLKNANAVCRAARAEISAGSLVGWYLKEAR